MEQYPPTDPTLEDQPAAANAADETTSDERTWAMVSHLCGLGAYLPVIPGLGGAIATLIIWLIKKEETHFLDDQGKEALNFELTVLIVAFVLGVLTAVPPVFCVTLPLLGVLAIWHIVFCIIAAIEANKGNYYRYPMTLRLVS